MSEPAPPPADDHAVPRPLLVVAVLLSCVSAWLAASDAMFFINDGPQHLFASVAALGVDEARAFSRYVTSNFSPTDRGITDVIQALTPLVGWRAAYKAAVVLAVLVWGWGFFAVAVTLSPRRARVGLLGFALAFQTPLFLGLLPFVLGSGLSLLGVAALRRPAPPRVQLLGAALAFALAAHVHVVAAAIGLGLLGALLAVEPGALAERARRFATVAAWPALVFAAVAWMSRDLEAGLVADPAPVALTTRAAELLRMFLLGGLEPWLVGAMLLAAAALSLVVARGRGRDGAAPALPRSSLALVLFAGAAAGFAWLAPGAFSGWGGAGDRTIPLAFCALFLAVPVEYLGARARLATTVAVAVLHIVVLARVRAVEGHILALHAPLLEALPRFEPAPRFWYGVSTRAHGPHAQAIPLPLDPAVHAAQLAALALGGVVEESHTASPALHVALLRPEVARHASSDPLGGNYFPSLTGDEPADLALVPRIAGLAAPFDGLLLYSPTPMPAVRAAFARHGFRTIAEGGGLSALALERCHYQVLLDGGAPGADVAWEVGPGGGAFPFARYVTRLDRTGAGAARLDALCGPIWLRPVDGACVSAAGDVAHADGTRESVQELRCSIRSSAR